MQFFKHIILSISVLSSFLTFSQDENSETTRCIYYTKDGSVIIGDLISDNFIASQLVIFTGDTILIPKDEIINRYKYRDLHYYPKGRFHYKSGVHIDINQGIGFGGNGGLTLLDISLNNRITPRIDAGIGVGSQRNFSTFTVLSGNNEMTFNINRHSIPLYVQGKYYLNKNRRSMYAHLRVGYTHGKDSDFLEQNTSKNGFLLNYGIGFSKATKGSVKTFFLISQTHNYASGTASAVDQRFFTGFQTERPQFDYNLWLNRLTFSWGLQINLSGKHKKF